jgi:hypothetical protein
MKGGGTFWAVFLGVVAGSLAAGVLSTMLAEVMARR